MARAALRLSCVQSTSCDSPRGAQKAMHSSHQALPETVPAGLRLDEQQPQLRRAAALVDHEHRADALAADLGDPAPLALGIELPQETARRCRRTSASKPSAPAVLARRTRAPWRSTTQPMSPGRCGRSVIRP